MESILESYLNDFSALYNFVSESPDKIFEHFVNYCVIPKLDNTKESIENVNVGGDNNPGIDGLAIVVNDHVVTTKEQVDYFLNALGRLEVEFYFVQAKTGNSFSMAEISSFLNCIKDYFGNKTTFNFNDETLRLFELKEYLFTKSLQMQENPSLNIIFATSGQWQDDQNLVAMKKIACEELEKLEIFSKVSFKPYDRNQLKTAYREIRNSITRSIEFEKHTILPAINDVDEAFIGMLPSKEFLKLICNDQEEILRNIFYDNVRDFQGFNTVNNEIKLTLETADDRDKFALLNNGITIVAKNIKKTGTIFTISDYQIVNGCQTSHVIYYNRKLLSDKIHIPTKIIVTKYPSGEVHLALN